MLGRDLPDGTRKKVTGLPGGGWGGGIFRPKPPVFDRSWRSPSNNTVKNSTEDTCSWTRPSKIGKRKVKKPRVFQLFDLNFLVCNIFFCGSAGGRARRRIFEFLDPFSDWFSSFCDSRNTGFYSVFLFSACLTASFKTSKNLVNYAVLCYGVNENIVNTSVFWRWLKNTVNYSVFGHLTLKNHGICSGFCFSPRKNTVNNSNFAVFSCFSLFFELCWSAIHGYQILRVFFFRQSVLSDVFGLNGRHHWQLRAAAQRCGAGGCRREATWISLLESLYIATIGGCNSDFLLFLLLCHHHGLNCLLIESLKHPRSSGRMCWT